MNSGLRLTVALLLVAFISIGFYFASLEDADRSEDASITRDPVTEVDTVSEPGSLADPEPLSESTPEPTPTPSRSTNRWWCAIRPSRPPTPRRPRPSHPRTTMSRRWSWTT